MSSIRYIAKMPGMVKSEMDKKSESKGKLVLDEEIVSLEIVGNRVRFERGWCSIQSEKGKMILEVMEEGVARPVDPLEEAMKRKQEAQEAKANELVFVAGQGHVIKKEVSCTHLIYQSLACTLL